MGVKSGVYVCVYLFFLTLTLTFGGGGGGGGIVNVGGLTGSPNPPLWSTLCFHLSQ